MSDARDVGAALRATLYDGPEPPADLVSALGAIGCQYRTPSAATASQLILTGNEWIQKKPLAEMKDRPGATLAWLYLHCAPPAEIRRVLWNPPAFAAAVQEWGDRRKEDGSPYLSPIHLALAEQLLTEVFAEHDASDFEIARKPDSPGPDPNEPGN